MDAYVLLGQRSDEPDNYSNLKSIIHDLLSNTDLGQESTDGENENRATMEHLPPSAWVRFPYSVGWHAEGWLRLHSPQLGQ